MSTQVKTHLHPKISDETMREMAKFFMKTSIPRIIAKEKEKKEARECQ